MSAPIPMRTVDTMRDLEAVVFDTLRRATSAADTFMAAMREYKNAPTNEEITRLVSEIHSQYTVISLVQGSFFSLQPKEILPEGVTVQGSAAVIQS